MVRRLRQQTAGQHKSMEQEEPSCGVSQDVLPVQPTDFATGAEADSQASPDDGCPCDPQDPCDEAIIDEILRRHYDGFRRLAKR